MDLPQNKIAFLCSSLSYGGLEMNIVRFAQWMKELKNKDILLFAVKNSPLYKDALEKGINIIEIPYHKKYFPVIKALKLKKKIKEHHIKKVLIRDNRDLGICAWAKFLTLNRKNRIKLIYHQAMQLSIAKKDMIHTIRFFYINKWISTVNYLKDEVISNTRFNRHKIDVIPLGIDFSKWNISLTKADAREALNLDNNSIYLGLIGRIDPLKGQEFLINVFAKIHNTYPNLKLLFAGEVTKNIADSYLQQLKNKIASHKLEQKITFLPFIKDVLLFLKAIDIFTMATKKETFGMVTIEAMAAGTPIIATNSGGTTELLGNGKYGELYKPENQEDFIEKLEGLLKNNSWQTTEKTSIAQEAAINKFSHISVCNLLEKSILNT